MITEPVGFQCRECVKGAPAVRTMRSLRRDPYVTYVLIAISVVLFLPTMGGGGALRRGGGDLARDLALNGPAVADGDWWRLVTSGFLHFGLLHLGFNMFLLWQLGSMLEPQLGRVRFALLYAVALLAGSLGVLLAAPNALTAGASGAVFGLMGAAFVGQRRRGVDPMQSGIGGLLVMNLLLTFAIPGISIGGHLGGLVGGSIAGAVLLADGDRTARLVGTAICAALLAGIVVAALGVADNPI